MEQRDALSSVSPGPGLVTTVGVVGAPLAKAVEAPEACLIVEKKPREELCGRVRGQRGGRLARLCRRARVMRAALRLVSFRV